MKTIISVCGSLALLTSISAASANPNVAGPTFERAGSTIIFAQKCDSGFEWDEQLGKCIQRRRGSF
ncbi:hypothetical protein MnTg02_01515 [bacterium MnTg02]|nr:hypothetical protein MnTg02_01515 [bacterium MnTg02]